MVLYRVRVRRYGDAGFDESRPVPPCPPSLLGAPQAPRAPRPPVLPPNLQFGKVYTPTASGVNGVKQKYVDVSRPTVNDRGISVKYLDTKPPFSGERKLVEKFVELDISTKPAVQTAAKSGCVRGKKVTEVKETVIEAEVVEEDDQGGQAKAKAEIIKDDKVEVKAGNVSKVQEEVQVTEVVDHKTSSKHSKRSSKAPSKKSVHGEQLEVIEEVNVEEVRRSSRAGSHKHDNGSRHMSRHLDEIREKEVITKDDHGTKIVDEVVEHKVDVKSDKGQKPRSSSNNVRDAKEEVKIDVKEKTSQGEVEVNEDIKVEIKKTGSHHSSPRSHHGSHKSHHKHHSKNNHHDAQIILPDPYAPPPDMSSPPQPYMTGALPLQQPVPAPQYAPPAGLGIQTQPQMQPVQAGTPPPMPLMQPQMPVQMQPQMLPTQQQMPPMQSMPQMQPPPGMPVQQLTAQALAPRSVAGSISSGYYGSYYTYGSGSSQRDSHHGSHHGSKHGSRRSGSHHSRDREKVSVHDGQVHKSHSHRSGSHRSITHRDGTHEEIRRESVRHESVRDDVGHGHDRKHNHGHSHSHGHRSHKSASKTPPAPTVLTLSSHDSQAIRVQERETIESVYGDKVRKVESIEVEEVGPRHAHSHRSRKSHRSVVEEVAVIKDDGKAEGIAVLTHDKHHGSHGSHGLHSHRQSGGSGRGSVHEHGHGHGLGHHSGSHRGDGHANHEVVEEVAVIRDEDDDKAAGVAISRHAGGSGGKHRSAGLLRYVAGVR